MAMEQHGGTQVPWVGINHLALITDDLDATVRFWHGVMGAELVATVARPTFRHYFFKLGTTTTVAFFEYTDPDDARVLSTDPVVKPAGRGHTSSAKLSLNRSKTKYPMKNTSTDPPSSAMSQRQCPCGPM